MYPILFFKNSLGKNGLWMGFVFLLGFLTLSGKAKDIGEQSAFKPLTSIGSSGLGRILPYPEERMPEQSPNSEPVLGFPVPQAENFPFV